jgi:glycosyltransferase 2 family protein
MSRSVHVTTATTTRDERDELDRHVPRPRAMFASSRGAARRRRASDVVLLGTALAALGLLGAVAANESFAGRRLADLLAALPGWLDPLWVSLYDLLAVWVLILLAGAVVARRYEAALEALGSALLATALAFAAARVFAGDWPSADAALRTTVGHPAFPAIRLAAEVAATLAISPALVRPVRRLGGWLVVLASASAVLVEVGSPSGVGASAAIAVAAAAVIRLAAGTTTGLPDAEDVAAALAEVGVRASGIEPLEGGRAGVTLVAAQDAGGRPLVVKVFGRDALDDRLVEVLWRAAWYRGDGGRRTGISRSGLVEHEALMTLLCAAAGVPTYAVVTAGRTSADDAVLVLRGAGTPACDLPEESIADDSLRAAWSALEAMHAAGIAHSQLSPQSLVLDERGQVRVADLGAAVAAATPDRMLADDAQLLATTSALAGGDRAVAAALETRRADGLAAMLPYLQPAAFDSALRRALRARRIEVDSLRAAAAEAAGAPAPELVRLRRVTWGTVFQSAMLVLAAGVLISEFGGLDYEQIASTLRHADWTWMVSGLVIAQVARVFQAVATLGSVPAALPFGPVYVMQLATNFLNLALPSSMARLAIDVRFFQRQGIAPATAVASSTIDAFAGNAVQVVLLVLVLAFSTTTLDVSLAAPPSGGARRILALLGVTAALVVILVVVARPLRRRVSAAVRRFWPDVRAAVSSLRASRKLACLVGGNVAAELVFASTLGVFAYAIGYPVALADLLLINLTVSLFASLIPVPGGIGVTEGGLMVGLTAAGLPQDAAFAVAVCDRMATFYLPPLWGWFAMRWLQRHRYL